MSTLKAGNDSEWGQERLMSTGVNVGVVSWTGEPGKSSRAWYVSTEECQRWRRGTRSKAYPRVDGLLMTSMINTKELCGELYQ